MAAGAGGGFGVYVEDQADIWVGELQGGEVDGVGPEEDGVVDEEAGMAGGVAGEQQGFDGVHDGAGGKSLDSAPVEGEELGGGVEGVALGFGCGGAGGFAGEVGEVCGRGVDGGVGEVGGVVIKQAEYVVCVQVGQQDC